MYKMNYTLGSIQVIHKIGFEILRVEKDGEIFDRLVKLRFVTYEDLYGATKEVHEEAWL